MYANIRAGVAQGIQTKDRIPRFPYTQAELTRVTGITFGHCAPCQDASTSLASLLGDITLPEVGAPNYRVPIQGIQEYGAYAPGGTVTRWGRDSQAAITALYSQLTSFMLVGYYGYLGAGNGSNRAAYCLFDAADGSNLLELIPNYGDLNYGARADDSVNAKTFNTNDNAPSPSDKIPRGHVFLYDASNTTVYYGVSGYPILSAAMGAWLGDTGATVAAAALSLGSWPGVNSTDVNVRYAMMAKGTQLDGLGPQLPALFRKLGWQ